MSPVQLRTEWSPYELRYSWDFLQSIWEHESDEAEQAAQKAKRRY